MYVFLIGKRNTKQKNYILNCLRYNSSKHITSSEIESVLKKYGTPVGKATIYRCLNLLVKEGSVRKYRIDKKSSSCYQYIDNMKNCKEHFHLICSNCSQTIHFENKELCSFIKALNFKDNFNIDVPKTLFYGLCQNCQMSE